MHTPDHVITINLNTAVDRVLEVPDLSIGAHAKGKQLSRFPAGKAINVSRALARVKCDSVATGFVGQGESLQFEQYLKDTGPGRIICQLLSVRGQTRENITLIDPINHTDTHIRDEGFEITDADFHRMMSKLGLLARPNAIMVFSGSLPRGMDVPKLNMLLMMAMSGGAKVVLDTAGDTLAQLVGMTPDDPAATETAHASSDLAPDDNLLWMIKPNRLELAQMMGKKDFDSDEEIIEAGRQVAKRVRWVVVTLGAQGAWLFHGKDAWRGTVDIDPKRVINTVGCGDSMIAGLLEGQICRANQSGNEAAANQLSARQSQGLANEKGNSADDGDDGDDEVSLSGATSGKKSAVQVQPDPVNLDAVTRGAYLPGERAGSGAGPAAFLKRGMAVATANSLSAGIAEFDLALVEEIQAAVHVQLHAS